MKQVHTLAILVALAVMMAASAAEAVSNAAVLYLRVAAGARPAGMGEAFVSVADDATATYWNPAGLGNSPIAGKIKRQRMPSAYGEITHAVTIEGLDGDSKTWVIADNRLLMFDGKNWNTGKVYMTSSDQSLYDFVRTIFNTDDDEQLRLMAEQVVAANCPVAADEVTAFADSIRAAIPEDYDDIEELERGLDTLISGHRMCLLRGERFRDLQRKLRDGLSDGTLTDDEIDRITYSIDGTVMRFLPGRLEVPYSAGVGGTMNCLGGIGRYLWVGTDNGAYRRSGLAWARYTVEDGLPSDTVFSMAGREDKLFIGTQRGMAQFRQGTITPFANVPASPVTEIVYPSLIEAYAAVDGVIYRFDGSDWSESFTYKVRIDDNLDEIIDRISIYHTPSEYEYLKGRIVALNADNVPQGEEAGVKMSGQAETPGEGTDATDTSTEESDVEEDTAESSDTAIEESDVSEDAVEATPTYPWLVEGNHILLPNSPRLPFEITAIHVGLYGDVWVGTTAGLLSFRGDAWTVYGYDRYIVPSPDSSDDSMTAEAIAREFLNTTDSVKIGILAENIDVYNELGGKPSQPGDTVYVYQRNLGSAISAIGTVGGELIVGTEFDVLRKTSSGWGPIEISGMRQNPVGNSPARWNKGSHPVRRSRLVAVYEHKGEAHYITDSHITVESGGRDEGVLMVAKWLPDLDVDMYYGYLSFVHNARGLGTFGLSLIYLTYGSIQFTDETGTVIGEESPYEITIAGSFGTSLNSNLKLGGTVKLIHSHLSSIGAGEEEGEGIAWAVAFDAGMLLKFAGRWQFGAAITNIGPDIKYVDAAQADPLPRNLAVGLSCRVWDTPYNRLLIQGELNKMLVGLNQGIGRELEYAIRHIGAEYWYADLIALRAGYKYDKEGVVKHLTFGAGLQIHPLRIDMAYIPSSIDSPLANTLRLSLSGMF